MARALLATLLCLFISLCAGSVTISVVAGTNISGFADGTGTDAQFDYAHGVAAMRCSSCNLPWSYDVSMLYVADTRNHRIRSISVQSGDVSTVSTVAGSGTKSFGDGIGEAAHFDVPWGVAAHGDFVYVVDQFNNRVRQVRTVYRMVRHHAYT